MDSHHNLHLPSFQPNLRRHQLYYSSICYNPIFPQCKQQFTKLAFKVTPDTGALGLVSCEVQDNSNGKDQGISIIFKLKDTLELVFHQNKETKCPQRHH